MRRLSRWAVLLAGTVMFVLSFLDLESPGDYTYFVAFGQAALESLVPYPDAATGVADAAGGAWATWPPGFVPLAAALARLDAVAHAPAVVSFQLLNLAALAATLLVVATWLTGRPALVRPADGRGGFEWDAPLMAVAVLVPLRMVLSNFGHAQINLLILGLVVTGVYLLDRRPLVGGLLFGVGSAIKATPIVLLAYLVWRGRWRALAAATVGVAVGWVLLPTVVLGPEGVVQWWQAWIGALPHSGGQAGWMNQSLRSVAVGGFGPGPGTGIWLAGVAVLAVAISLVFGRPFRPVGSRRTAIEVAILLVAVTIVSPVSWKAHYVTLVPLCAALFAMIREADGWRRRVGVASLATAAAGLNLTSPELIGRDATRWLEGGGLVLWIALLLTIAGLVLLGRPRGETRAARPE